MIPKVYRVEFVPKAVLEDRLNEINMSRNFSIISVQPLDNQEFVVVVVDLREIDGEFRSDEVAN